MAAEKKIVASLVNLCHLFMKEVGMPDMALQELLSRASATSGLESLESVRFWKFATEPFHVLEEKVATGPFEPTMNLRKHPIPDLNQPAPENEEPWELDLELKLFNGKAFANLQVVEGEGSTTAGKRKMRQANYSLVKKMKFAEENVGPANNEKGKGVLEMEGCGSN